MRTRGLLAALLVGASSAVFAFAWPWPQQSAPPGPVDDVDRLALYEESLDIRWADLFPDASRPDVGEIAPPSDVDEWNDVMGSCLESVGYQVTDYSSGISYTSPPGVDPERLSVGGFVCESRYPYPGQLDLLMSTEQRAALYDYFTGYLVSCLALAGVESDTRAPSRASFVEESVMGPSWTPYTAVWSRAETDEEFAEFERRCPSEPAWRRQAYLFATVD